MQIPSQNITSWVSNWNSWLWLKMLLFGAILTRWWLNSPFVSLEVTICFNSTPANVGCLFHGTFSKLNVLPGMTSYPWLNFSNKAVIICLLLFYGHILWLLETKEFLAKERWKQEEYIMFAQEKYSNGETSLQYFEEYIQPNALYLLDEPEVSLSPANQVTLAEELNKMARLLECQFIIATHSPFMLGTLNGKIYNLDTQEYDVAKWNELENVRYFYDFFKKHRKEFE